MATIRRIILSAAIPLILISIITYDKDTLAGEQNESDLIPGPGEPEPDKIRKIFIGNKLADRILKDKQEGWSPIIIPILNYKTLRSAGFGLTGGATYNGHKGDPYFDYAPFAYGIAAQAFYSLTGEQDYYFSLNIPYFLNSPIQIIASFEYDKLPNATYYGISTAINDRLITRYGARYRSYDRYDKRFLSAYDPFNPVSPLYTEKVNYAFNDYNYTMLMGSLAGILNIAKYFKVLMGYVFKKVDVSSWTGRRFDIPPARDAITSPTLIDLDPAVFLQKRHGLISNVKFGVGLDTRDYPPDPKEGILVDYTLNVCSEYLGSTFSYTRSTAGARFYFSPVEQLTFAARIGYTTVTGRTPFYELGTFSFLMEEQAGLGNDSTLRGYQYNRFIGYTMTVGNCEARWEFVRFILLEQKFALKLIAFVDAGSVFKHPLEPFKKWSDYHIGYGPGFILSYNLSTILHLYIGFSKEDMTISFDFNHAF